MTSIKFERVERDCAANKTIRDGGETGHLIYDFKVMIDGEHRATWIKNGFSRGYCLYDADHRPIKWLNYGSKHRGDEVDKKADFEPKIAELLLAEKIPTLARRAELRAEEEAARIADAEAEEARCRENLARAAGPDLLAAANILLEAADEGDSDKAMDGYGALRAAVAKAEGRP